MLVSTCIGTLVKRFGFKKTLDLVKSAGFTAFDLTLCGNSAFPCAPFDGEDWKETAKEMREYADSIGLPCNQSHAVFGSWLGAAKPGTDLFEGTVRSMEIAAIMGAKAIVVHPLQYLCYMSNVDFLRQENLEFYKDLMPYAEKLGIVVLTENMWQGNPNNNCIIQSVCAEAKEFAQYVDMIDSPYMKACLDIGHTILTGESITNMVKTLGRDRLFGLHIHDVDGKSDDHTLPYTKSVNFDEMIQALAAIDYAGDITFESSKFAVGFPDELVPSALRLLADTGHYFAKAIETAKNGEA
jgi:sugar phosphate isomerase/epimerase